MQTIITCMTESKKKKIDESFEEPNQLGKQQEKDRRNAKHGTILFTRIDTDSELHSHCEDDVGRREIKRLSSTTK